MSAPEEAPPYPEPWWAHVGRDRSGRFVSLDNLAAHNGGFCKCCDPLPAVEVVGKLVDKSA